MNGETIRPNEEEIFVFISSRQDEEMAEARALAIKTVDDYPGVRVWAFEDAPAGSEAARNRYLRNAEKAEIVIWLIGSTTTEPVAEEIDASLRVENKLLPFKLPAPQRDSMTGELIERVGKEVTWRKVENVEMLREHISIALTDELVRGYRDPAPVNHDQYLRNQLRQSLAETKRLWTTLGVPDDIARELAEDQSIGHKLQPPESGITRVIAPQGAGKTLAGLRLYQHAVSNRLTNRLQPLPLFLNARNTCGELSNDLEDAARGQGSVAAQQILVVIDGLDEVGRFKANQILNQAVTIADANQKTAIVVLTRPLPGLKTAGNSIVLSECTDDEFLSIASRVAGRSIDNRNIPYSVFKTYIPLFAVIIGSLLRDLENVRERTPSEIISLLVGRILEDTEDFAEDTAEPLKKLAVKVTNTGESAYKSEVDSKSSVHKLLGNSRLVVEQTERIDFALAIFREWFAARALVERTTILNEVDLETDRWVVPLAIAINSEDSSLGNEIMEFVACEDPGMASLILEEVKHSWSALDCGGDQLLESPKEIGYAILRAMKCWKEGLGQLSAVIKPFQETGDIPPLGISKGLGTLAVAWYRGEEEREPVIELDECRNPYWAVDSQNWPSWKIGPVELTRVWQWTVTRESLSESLSDQIDALQMALGSPIGLREYVAEFAEFMSNMGSLRASIPTIDELITYIERWTGDRDGREVTTITLRQRTYTKAGLEAIRTEPGETLKGGLRSPP